MPGGSTYKAIAIGSSAGGLFALSSLLEKLPADYPIPIVIVQHRSRDQRELLEEVLQHKCNLKVKQADEKEEIKNGFVYIAPPDYHLLVENDMTFSLSSDAQVRFSRPSIDVLFESASTVFKDKLVGIILTGANNDGAAGISAIYEKGGLTIAQNPEEAPFPVMPESAIQTGKVKFNFSISEIQNFLLKLINQ